MNKIYRLKKNHDIATIVQKRQRIGRENYIVYYQYNNESIPKVAFSVSKKYGTAVERNKAKRIARAITQKSIEKLEKVAFVVVIKFCAKGKKFDILEKELSSILRTIFVRQPKGEKNENKKKI